MTSNAFSADAIAELVDALGTDAFADRLWIWIRKDFPIHHMTCLRFHQAEPSGEVSAVDLLFWRSADPPEVFHRGYDNYIRKHWRHDPIVRFLADLKEGASMLVQVNQPSDTSPNYYDEILRQNDMTDECALARRARGGVFNLSLFRNKNGPAELSIELLGRLKMLSTLMLALIERHWRLTHGKTEQHTQLSNISALLLERLVLERLELSERELVTCQAYLKGITTPQIAEQLGVKQSSVKTYLNRAYDKIGVRTRSELYQWCMSGALAQTWLQQGATSGSDRAPSIV